LHFNENKADIHNKATTDIYNPYNVVNTENKRNFSTIASRVRASQSRSHCRCRIPGEQEKKDRRSTRNFSGHHHQTTAVVTTARYCCCRRNSYADVTDETATTRLVDHRSVPPAQIVALRRFRNHGTPFTGDKTPHHRQHHASTNLHDLHTSFTREEDVYSHRQLKLDWLARQRAADLHCQPSP